MKFVHLADLHIGKRVNEFSMIEDQKYILKKILNIIDEQKPDGVIIAGDVYDKSVPSAEAVELFDDFLFSLSKREIKVFVISGNHDSAERIAFGGRLMDKSGIYMSPVYNGKIEPITMTDDFGEVKVYMLPFVKPSNVRAFYPDREISSYTDALKVAVEEMKIDASKRNILVTHQFVTGASRTDSEEISVGGTDNVDAAVFEDFDYVALTIAESGFEGALMLEVARYNSKVYDNITAEEYYRLAGNAASRLDETIAEIRKNLNS